MIAAEFLVYIGVILLVFAVLAFVADTQERREDRELNRRFRENQRLRRG